MKSDGDASSCLADDSDDQIGAGRRLSGDLQWRTATEQQMWPVEEPRHCGSVVLPEPARFKQHAGNAMDSLALLDRGGVPKGLGRACWNGHRTMQL